MTHRESFIKKYDLEEDESYSLSELSEITGVPYAALHSVYRRGLGAARSNLSSVRLLGTFEKNADTRRFPKSMRLSAPQWAMARVYSFLDRGTTFHTADSDIVEKYNLEKIIHK